tara:strand:+ start:3764 stop:5641 length:1878 start_codon:yes stop_codon:yes gene_type:complete
MKTLSSPKYKTMIMKKTFYYLLALTLLIISCSKKENIIEDTPSVTIPKTISFNGGKTFNHKVNFISTDSVPISSDILEAKINGETLHIKKIDSSTWAYSLTGITNYDQEINLTFTLNNDNYTVSHKVKEIVLDKTPDVISENFFNQIETSKIDLNDSKINSEIENISNAFDDAWSKATEQQKKEFAEFYTVNKQVFDNLLGDNIPQNKSFIPLQNKTQISDSNKLALSFGLSVYNLGISIQMGIRSIGNPPLAIAFAGSALISFKIAEYSWGKYATLQLEILDFELNEEPQNKSSIKQKSSVLSYTQNEGNNKFYSLRVKTRNISENSNSPILARVWNNYQSLNSIAGSINAVIDYANNYNPFIPIPNVKYPNPPAILSETRGLNSDDYKSLSISKGAGNLNQSETFSSGGINLKFSKKTNIEYDETKINTAVGVALNSEYGNANTSFPITVLLKDCNDVFGGTAFINECDVCVGGNTGKTEEEECQENPFLGNWTAASFNGGKSMGEMQRSGFIAECNVYTEQWTINSASINITENNVSINISQSSSASGWSGSEGEVDCESITLKFDTSNFNINDSYTINNSTSANLDTSIDCEGEGNNISTLSISNNKLILKYCELTLTFQK